MKTVSVCGQINSEEEIEFMQFSIHSVKTVKAINTAYYLLSPFIFFKSAHFIMYGCSPVIKSALIQPDMRR